MNQVMKMLRLEKRHITTGTPISPALPGGKMSTDAGRTMDQELGYHEERKYTGCQGLGEGEMVIDRYNPSFPFQTILPPPDRYRMVQCPGRVVDILEASGAFDLGSNPSRGVPFFSLDFVPPIPYQRVLFRATARIPGWVA